LSLPNAAFTYLRSHGALDLEHIVFFEKLMNRVSDKEDQYDIIHAANVFYRLYAEIFRTLKEESFPSAVDMEAGSYHASSFS